MLRFGSHMILVSCRFSLYPTLFTALSKTRKNINFRNSEEDEFDRRIVRGGGVIAEFLLRRPVLSSCKNISLC